MVSSTHYQASPLVRRALAPAASQLHLILHTSALSHLSLSLSLSQDLKMPGLFLFCLLSTQLAVTTVMARPFPVLSFDAGAMRSFAEAPGALHVHSLLEHKFAGSPLGSHHGSHGPFDRHFAGGKIIVGGLTAAVLVAVFCYIRITRTKKQVVEPKS